MPATPTRRPVGQSELVTVKRHVRASDDLIAALKRRRINSLGDIRRRGGLQQVANLPVTERSKTVERLEAHARLELVQSDPAINQKLIVKGYDSPRKIATTPLPKFRLDMAKGLGEVTATQLHETATAQSSYLDQLSLDRLVEAGRKRDTRSLPEELRDQIRERCGCRDCEAAMSPGAYLADLIKFAIDHVRRSGTAEKLELNDLVEQLQQPVSLLPVDCESVDTPIRQVRICVEALRRYHRTTAPDQPALSAAQQDYMNGAYRDLLLANGAQRDELRLAVKGSNAEKSDLAARLGIGPVRLSELWREPQGLSEAVLEDIFGLRETSGDPLRPTRSANLVEWRREILRQSWEQQDRTEADGTPPIIDPDLMFPSDFLSPSPSNAAFALWTSRRRWVDARLSRYRQSATRGIEPTIAAAGLRVDQLREISNRRDEGFEIGEDLSRLGLAVDAFNHLLKLMQFADRRIRLGEDEIEELAAILAQAGKLRSYQAWRRQEADRKITLSPDFFQIPKPSNFRFPPPEPPELPAWLADPTRRNMWRNKLSGRIAQQDSLTEAVAASTSEVEAVWLPKLRDALIDATPVPQEHVDDKATYLSNRLFIDTRNDGCKTTTRIAQAIESLQSLIWSARTGVTGDFLLADVANFDEAWKWMGSYATWRGAIMIFLYPENLLHPALRHRRSWGFARLADELRGNPRLNPETACEAAERHAEYIRDLSRLRAGASCTALTFRRTSKCDNPDQSPSLAPSLPFYMFAQGRSGAIYWSTDSSGTIETSGPEVLRAFSPSTSVAGGTAALWEPVPDVEDYESVKIVGAVPFRTSEAERYIYLFLKVRDAGSESLVVKRFDLDHSRWRRGEEIILELPEHRAPIQIVIEQRETESAAPRLAAMGLGAPIFVASLSRDGKSLDQSGWVPMPESLGTIDVGNKHRIMSLEGMARLKNGEHALFVRTYGGPLYMKSESNSGWIVAGEGRFVGLILLAARERLLHCFMKPGESNVTIVSISTANFIPTSFGELDFSEEDVESIAPHCSSLTAPPDRIFHRWGQQSNPSPTQRVGSYKAKVSLAQGSATVDAVDIAPLGPRFQVEDQLNARLDRRGSQVRADAITAAFERNAPLSGTFPVYLSESFYFVPLLVALSLQERGHYIAALDWYRAVYDYDSPSERARLYAGLRLEKTDDSESSYGRVSDWYLDPLNPHGVAATRAHAYTRYTLLSIIRCLLDYGDSEFTRDTNESLARARLLYETALRLLDHPTLREAEDPCERSIGDLEIDVGDPLYVEGIVAELQSLSDVKNVEQASRLIASAASRVDYLEKARSRVRQLRGEEQASASTAGSVVSGGAAHGSVIDQVLIKEKAVEESLVEISTLKLGPGSTISQGLLPSFSFCIPANPLYRALRLHADLNLYKIRTCRNIAGMSRAVEPYSAPTDTESGLPVIGAGGSLALPGPISLPPTAYRYSALIARVKQLTEMASQFENAMLSALQSRDNEAYNLLKARQDLRLARKGLRVQESRVREAEDGVKLAELQQQRSQIQTDHFQRLLEEGISALERQSIQLLRVAADLHQAASFTSFVAAALPSSVGIGGPTFSPQGAAGSVASAFSGQAAARSTQSSVLSGMASFERRRQDWELNLQLSLQDSAIGAQATTLAKDRVRISNQEREIAEAQTSFAEDSVNYLANKFTSVELYDWMSGVLEQVYAFFLQQATAVARSAEAQLAFERQEAPPAIIQEDYWEAPAEGFGAAQDDDEAPDRRGLTGSARLARDVYELDQYAFETDRRKLHMTRTLSLAHLDPYAFQVFRETGVLPFATPMGLFDRDFPGHYLRLIKQVHVSVAALVPPNQGIRATLRNVGSSHVVLGGPAYSRVAVLRGAESIALTSPVSDTGVFELEPHPEKLRPFEGLGVDTLWQFEMPKAANPFDYRSIADVLVSLEYAALESHDYRAQVIQGMDPMLSADRSFSFRHGFADAWYDLNNAELTETPMSVSFEVRREDFPANIDQLTIDHVALYFARTQGTSFEIQDVTLAIDGTGGSGATIDGLISTRSGNGTSLLATLATRSPVGRWQLTLPTDQVVQGHFREERVEDILLVVSYRGNPPSWPN